MAKIRENNGMEEIGLVTPPPELVWMNTGIQVWTKWVWFLRRHFEAKFLQWFNFLVISVKFYSTQ